MPSRPPASCTTPGCPGKVTSPGPCPPCRDRRAAERRRRDAPVLALYLDPRWATLSRRTLREEPRCRTCGAPSQHADHIVPVRAGGAPFDRRNTQGLCQRCHAAKTARETGFGGHG